MTEVQKYKQAKAVINDIPNYMEYQPTKEQNEAFDVVLELLNEAIEKATIPCFECRHYREMDAEWHSGQCEYHICQTFAEETCDYGERPQNKWVKIFENPFTNGYKCPFCGHKIQVTEQFLPKVTECESCGADMKGGAE